MAKKIDTRTTRQLPTRNREPCSEPLRHNRMDLLELFTFMSLINYLYQEECIDHKERDEIKKLEGEKERIEKLLDILETKDPSNWQKFCEGLKNYDANEMVRKLLHKPCKICTKKRSDAGAKPEEIVPRKDDKAVIPIIANDPTQRGLQDIGRKEYLVKEREAGLQKILRIQQGLIELYESDSLAVQEPTVQTKLKQRPNITVIMNSMKITELEEDNNELQRQLQDLVAVRQRLKAEIAKVIDDISDSLHPFASSHRMEYQKQPQSVESPTGKVCQPQDSYTNQETSHLNNEGRFDGENAYLEISRLQELKDQRQRQVDTLKPQNTILEKELEHFHISKKPAHVGKGKQRGDVISSSDADDDSKVPQTSPTHDNLQRRNPNNTDY